MVTIYITRDSNVTAHQNEFYSGWSDHEPRSKYGIRQLLAGGVYVTAVYKVLITPLTVEHRSYVITGLPVITCVPVCHMDL